VTAGSARAPPDSCRWQLWQYLALRFFLSLAVHIDAHEHLDRNTLVGAHVLCFVDPTHMHPHMLAGGIVAAQTQVRPRLKLRQQQRTHRPNFPRPMPYVRW
jgi:hypothetical protein